MWGARTRRGNMVSNCHLILVLPATYVGVSWAPEQRHGQRSSRALRLDRAGDDEGRWMVDGYRQKYAGAAALSGAASRHEER
jgi:hypothetical protein